MHRTRTVRIHFLVLHFKFFGFVFPHICGCGFTVGTVAACRISAQNVFTFSIQHTQDWVEGKFYVWERIVVVHCLPDFSDFFLQPVEFSLGRVTSFFFKCKPKIYSYIHLYNFEAFIQYQSFEGGMMKSEK